MFPSSDLAVVRAVKGLSITRNYKYFNNKMVVKNLLRKYSLLLQKTLVCTNTVNMKFRLIRTLFRSPSKPF